MLITRAFRLSNTSYALMTVFIILHTIGGHYTFERVPFGAVSGFFGFERNHFDRVAHFAVGLRLSDRRVPDGQAPGARALDRCAVPAVRHRHRRRRLRNHRVAVRAELDPAAGIAVLGSQGDIWDAQRHPRRHPRRVAGDRRVFRPPPAGTENPCALRPAQE